MTSDLVSAFARRALEFLRPHVKEGADPEDVKYANMHVRVGNVGPAAAQRKQAKALGAPGSQDWDIPIVTTLLSERFKNYERNPRPFTLGQLIAHDFTDYCVGWDPVYYAAHAQFKADADYFGPFQGVQSYTELNDRVRRHLANE